MTDHKSITFEDIPKGFYWFNEPAYFNVGNGLEIYTEEKTDFWQKTHYGFRRDDGHCLFTKLTADFSVKTLVEFEPVNQYDQCGLMVRVDEKNWIKMSTEYENKELSRLGSVITNFGYSDWATTNTSSERRKMWYHISRRENDFLIQNSFDGETWYQMRIAHMHAAHEEVEVGVYACSPIGKNFKCRFIKLIIGENEWHNY